MSILRSVSCGLGVATLSLQLPASASAAPLAQQCGAVGIVTYDLPPVTETHTTLVPVPYAWLDAHVSGEVNESEAYEASAQATAANGRKVWECYALGLDPEDNSATNDFKITSFPLKPDGTPDIEHIVFDPPQARWNVPATYKVKGAAELNGPWQEVGGGGLGETALPGDCRFFKVEVVLP